MSSVVSRSLPVRVCAVMAAAGLSLSPVRVAGHAPRIASADERLDFIYHL